MGKKITKRVVDALAPGTIVADGEIKGFVARRLPSGTVTYGYRYRNSSGKQRWHPLGLHGAITPDEARRLAKRTAGDVAHGRDPSEDRASTRAAAKNTVNAALDTFLERHAKNLRTAKTIARLFERCVRPRIGNQSIYTVGRWDIVDLLDWVEDNKGAVVADKVLSRLRAAFNWYMVRDDKFKSPIIKGLARTKPTERARSRTLSDDELRDVWAALGTMPPVYAAFVRTLLLSAQRRDEVRCAEWNEIDNRIWTIPGNRYKTGKDHHVPMTAAIEAQLVAAAGDRRGGFIFSNDGGTRAIGNMSKLKARLDRAVTARRGGKELPPWQIHDLRRTARSLMSRDGVLPDHAERTIGHTIGDIRGVYDRYTYAEEKLEALQRLASLIERILHPGAAVVAFPGRSA